jgi:preprotein translocase subunit SecA
MKITSRLKLGKEIFKLFKTAYDALENIYPAAELRKREKTIGLMVIDKLWTEHLYTMEQLQDAVGLLQYAEIQPLAAYRIEGYKMWQKTLKDIRDKIVYGVFRGSLS